ncbi:type 1 fimbrial protein [Cronobacter malonaticus]|nr:type 1 fimbrial protein [Cronobacter malonaticus]
MNKNLIVRTILATVMMGASAASMAAAHHVGTNTATISGSFVSATCSVIEWPHDVTFDPVSLGDWPKLPVNQAVQTVEQGAFKLANCPANTRIKYSVQVPHVVDGNPFHAFPEADDGKVVKGIGITFAATDGFAVPWKVDGTEANLGTTDDKGELTVPAYARLVKRNDNLSKDNAPWTGGNIKVVATYNVSYD